jgi:hypothetical protein
MAMVRKQIYLERKQDEKLKRLAKSLNVPEAEVIRRAIESLPEGWSAEPASARLIREVATIPYGGVMDAGNHLNRDSGQNRRLDHLAWEEELAFIRERAGKLAGTQRAERAWTREELYDKRRLRLPD